MERLAQGDPPRTVQGMNEDDEDDEDSILEVGPPTPEEREALAAILRKECGIELAADSPVIVGRRFTAEDLRAQAEAAAEKFERGGA